VILGLETSCDDTCAALVSREGDVRANVIASQGLLHARYGGVVPEVASRHHLELLDAVLDDALERAGVALDAVETVAVTRGPGLIGALLVGVSAAKALAAARELPLVPVDHLHGHVTASLLAPDPIGLPYGVLVASGGHTFVARVDEPGSYRTLGQTLDDAAGEAFDKGGRILGLPYPAGPEIDRLAREGDPERHAFPRSLPGRGLDFSFSGLKTALLYRVRDLGPERAEEERPHLAASYQRAIVDVLAARARALLERERLERLALGGGVAANSEVRTRMRSLCDEVGAGLWVPEPALCTDNAAMIAGAARWVPALPFPEYLALDASPRGGA
jgi:N6-L-threonylcarbamoyladenine synthase